METAYDGSNNIADESRELRGSSWVFNRGTSGPSGSDADVVFNRGTSDALERLYDFLLETAESHHLSDGFRVASVPEPSTFSLLAIGLGGLALVRRRK
jgi:hypothetical protein